MGTEQERHTAFTVQYYGRGSEGRQTLMSGYGDAAHMCDAVAADIEREHTVRGRVTFRGQALAAAVRRAGDAIWSLREIVPERRPTPTPTPASDAEAGS